MASAIVGAKWAEVLARWDADVPGDWVTGSRTLDILLLPLVFAFTFPLLRLALKRWVFEVCAQAHHAASRLSSLVLAGVLIP
jgi:hypothetical protein